MKSEVVLVGHVGDDSECVAYLAKYGEGVSFE